MVHIRGQNKYEHERGGGNTSPTSCSLSQTLSKIGENLQKTPIIVAFSGIPKYFSGLASVARFSFSAKSITKYRFSWKYIIRGNTATSMVLVYRAFAF